VKNRFAFDNLDYKVDNDSLSVRFKIKQGTFFLHEMNESMII